MPELIEIDNSLSAFQEAVGGYIAALGLNDDNVLFVINEEGKLKHLPPNKVLTRFAKPCGLLVGNILLVGGDHNDDSFYSVPDELIDKYLGLLSGPVIEI